MSLKIHNQFETHLFLLARFQAALRLGQTLGERKEQAGDVTHVVDVGAELGGFAGTDLLRQLGKEILAQLVIGRALLGDSLLLTLQGANFLVQMLYELIL